jgi:MoxR-like ATPase
LLEAMEEGQVTIDGQTRELPAPFFIIATQNPATQSGTYPLPESQLDRFLMRISLGYPDQDAERKLFQGEDSHKKLQHLKSCLSIQQLVSIQKSVDDIHASDNLLDYLQRLVAVTRESADFACGVSPRGALALLRCAKTWALMSGRGHAVPEDIQTVLPSVLEHRMSSSLDYHSDSHALSQKLLQEVAVIV